MRSFGLDEDWNFEIQFYEKLIEKKPDFIEALMALGDVYTKQGMYQKGLEMDQRLLSLRSNDPVFLYNLACDYSLLKDVDMAFRMVKKAINNGYDELEHLEKDPDLRNLHQDSRFKRYFLRLKNKRSPEVVRI